MLQIKLRWKGKCPKHPRYNPEKQGAGYVSSCRYCPYLYSIHVALRKVRYLQVNFEDEISLTAKEAYGNRSVGNTA